MKASFIVPVFNQPELTRACLDSLTATTTAVESEIIVVDDGSDADTQAALAPYADADRITLLRQPENRGYASACNAGATQANGELLFLLNSDLEFLDGWLQPMLDAFQDLERPGLVGNVQLDPKTGDVDHAGCYAGWDTVIRHQRKPHRRWLLAPKYAKAHFITAACCAIRRQLFLDLGGYDEAFLNGCEDFDLCFRLDQLGYGIHVANRSRVRHHVSASRPASDLNQEKNYRLFQRRWRDRIVPLSAQRWADHYVDRLITDRRCFHRHLAGQAFVRWSCLVKGPAPAGLYLARCRADRNERHWLATIDGWSDERIKDFERRRYAGWRSGRIDYQGLFLGRGGESGVWLKDTASITLPKGLSANTLSLSGEILSEDPDAPETKGPLGLRLLVNGVESHVAFPLPPGPFSLDIDSPPIPARDGAELKIELLGVARSNAYAFLGRKLEHAALIPQRTRRRLQTYRPQRKNQRLRLHALSLNREDILDFAANPSSPQNFDYLRKNANAGINLVGWFKAELGIGESVRLAAKALGKSRIDHALVPLKVNCMARQGDTSLDHRLTDDAPYPINVFHIDAPQSADIDHHHGPQFRRDRYNIAYWAWELPEFPDHWMQYFQYFDEIWTPSNFVRDAIAMKSPLPVVTLPHCIDFDVPSEDYRERLDLPRDRFLFCFAYDLNSYQGRKNPDAVIEAYRQAFQHSDRSRDVGLVIKTQSKENNPEEYAKLVAALRDLPNTYLIDRTLPRRDVYGLMNACDSYVSLHRAEGFGLTVAESMFMGKPVLSTNWSATTEFLNENNGCPVAFQLVRLAENHGPYQKGQVWADADPADAAAKMLRLVNDSDWARQLGQNAARSMRELYSPQRVAALYEQRVKAISSW